MCGIAGTVLTKPFNQDNLLEEVSSMIEELVHRGPDSHGTWSNEDSNIALGHRRLSILDLSINGSQPMVSSCGRFVVVFNGEIYNHLEIREGLSQYKKNISWNSTSDTETLLTSCSILGLNKTIDMLRGMFSFALWDIENKELFLVRDRLGEKPLYYCNLGNKFIFSSELKPFFKIKNFEKKINMKALCRYLEYSFMSGNESILEGIYKLEPGHFLKFSQRTGDIEKIKYWDPEEFTTYKKKFTGSKKQAKEKLILLLNQSVEDQMLSDVPIGGFLSGGIDSSLIISTMKNFSAESIKTFSIGFNEADYNEAEHAKKVSEFLSTDHHEYYFSSRDLINLLPELPKIYDEPFSDVSQLPTILLSRIAKKEITVCLSGDGGDELFGGYSRHVWGGYLAFFVKLLPRSIRNLIANIIRLCVNLKLGNFLNKFLKANFIDEKLLKFSKAFQSKNTQDIYNSLLTNNICSEKLLKPKHLAFKKDVNSNRLKFRSFADELMFSDLKIYLPDDILVKVDRAAMSCSLETRIPFLDHNLVEFALSLPKDFKLDKTEGKSILKEILYEKVPKDILDRPKAGFSVPISNWLRKDIKELALKYLSEEFLIQQDIFNAKEVENIWSAHQSELKDYSREIWTLLMFQIWYEEWMT